MLVTTTLGCGRAEWRDASARLHAATAADRAEGYRPLSGRNNDFGVFSDSGMKRWRVWFDSGASYLVAGACTSGCDRLTFEVDAPNGAPLVAETGAGTTPRILFTPPARGPHLVTVRYGDCATRRCRWVGQVFQKRG